MGRWFCEALIAVCANLVWRPPAPTVRDSAIPMIYQGFLDLARIYSRAARASQRGSRSRAKCASTNKHLHFCCRPRRTTRAWIETSKTRGRSSPRCVARVARRGRGLKHFGLTADPFMDDVARVARRGRGLKLLGHLDRRLGKASPASHDAGVD
jgi:hypothetical protein